MEARAFLYACIVGLILVVWLAEAAPIDSISDEEHLKRTLYKLDSVLDELIQRTEDSHTSYQKRNEEKRAGSTSVVSSYPEKRGDSPWIISSNPDGPVPYRNLKREQDAFMRDFQGDKEINMPSTATSENNLRKVLRYLADMEQKLQKRDHE